MIYPPKFTLEQSEAAWKGWRFNCGPASLCAVLGMTPDEIRPHLLDFESKGYTNPTLMFAVLDGLNVRHRLAYRSDDPAWIDSLPFGFGAFGLVRVQWGGPWTAPGVPMKARYRHTHWAAFCRGHVFDVNAMFCNGWLTYAEWSGRLIPWLIREAVPRADGAWWPTHVIEIAKGAAA